MSTRVFFSTAALVAGALLSGCVTREVRPLEKIHPIQAQTQIPAAQLLDVAIRELDASVPQDIAGDEEKLARRRIFPEIRKAESRYLASLLRSTLESSGQWGAVRVVPAGVDFVDVLVSGRILESTGKVLALEITATDSVGRTWIAHRRYESVADAGSYKSTEALKARDPFQNVFSRIANDLLAAREQLSPAAREEIRRVTGLRFAADLAPQAMGSYLARGGDGQLHVARLPAEGDPFEARISRIRERDAGVIDTVNGYYANFAEQMQNSYGAWRQASYTEIEKEDRARTQARTRTILGAAAVLGAIFVPDQCSPEDYNCRRVQSAARTAATVGGTAAVLSGIKKFSDARVAGQAVKELAESFQGEVSPQVVDLEGRTLRLTGSAEEQYREWRRILRELYLEEAGDVVTPPAAPAARATETDASR
ncbi:MAG: hypothetical protein IPI06_13795 [Gammaproteobacteria bacterium]|nr:hypothetical protein [Gammaproteobacteria bacterium]